MELRSEMKIEMHIGSGINDFVVARNILSNIGSRLQRVAIMSNVASSYWNTSRMIEVGIKVESDYSARIGRISCDSLFNQFDVEFDGRKTTVSVSDADRKVCHGFDVVHLYRGELFFDGLCSIGTVEFEEMCGDAEKAILYFSEPYVATKGAVDLVRRLSALHQVSFLYYPRNMKLIESETVGDFCICDKCNHRINVGRPDEVCSEVHLKLADSDTVNEMVVGDDVRCTTCGRKVRDKDGWRLLVNNNCLYYTEHFLGGIDNGV